MKEKTIYELNLHEWVLIKEIDTSVTRVPGGWIYYNETDSPVFVPFNNEFLHSDKFRYP